MTHFALAGNEFSSMAIRNGVECCSSSHTLSQLKPFIAASEVSRRMDTLLSEQICSISPLMRWPIILAAWGRRCLFFSNCWKIDVFLPRAKLFPLPFLLFLLFPFTSPSFSLPSLLSPLPSLFPFSLLSLLPSLSPFFPPLPVP